MALKSTIYKANLQIADMDRHYYADHQLNIACHPSETLERMMVRILVFSLHAQQYLEFGNGMSDADEPDLAQKDLTGTVEKWIEIGQPEERPVLKACGKAQQVLVYAYSSGATVWWKQISGKLERAKNLTVCQIPADTSKQLEKLCQRSMQLQVTIQDGEIWMRDDSHAVQVQVTTLMQAK
jgi:uncharacterized protein YaeQ